MKFKVFLVLLIFGVLPVKLNKYELIIIPIPKGSINTLINHYIERGNRIGHNSDRDKLDIEHYVEPTEQPDIDTFDYNAGKTKVLKKENGTITREGDEDLEEVYGEDKIIGGDEVDINLYPYNAEYGYNCGGAIIDKKWVLTVAHCRTMSDFVRVGSKHKDQGTEINVKRHFKHPSWDAKSKEHEFDYDYQLLELEKPLRFNDNIQPIKIARTKDMKIGKFVTVTGWGNIAEGGPSSKVLRAVRVPIVSKKKCNKADFPYFRGTLTPRMFCAGTTEATKDACQGDSGGPAAYRDRLLGLVSFSAGCARPGTYGVYSKLTKIRGWIEWVTGLKLK